MTKAQFIKEMENIRLQQQKTNCFIEKLDDVFPGSFEAIYENVDATEERLHFIAELVGGEEAIFHYVYETDWNGFNDYDLNGNAVSEVYSLSALFDYIVNN